MSTRDRAFYAQHYQTEKKSIREIAASEGTYPAKIFREIKALEIPILSKSEIQTKRLETTEHPTKGRARTEDEKTRIATGIAENWASLSKEEVTARVKANLLDFRTMDQDQRRDIQKLANKQIKRTAKDGSKIENYFIQKLTEKGYNVVFHKELPLKERLVVDIIISSYNLVIEVDGISHHKPVWGEAKLEQQQRADREKNAILLSNGYMVLRFRLGHRNYNLSKMYKAFLVLEKIVKELIESKKLGVYEATDENV